jgi:hypothetical protein
VMVRARMRALSGWSDTCILNVSSRGLMINGTAPVRGDTVELWHGEHVIVATVMWRKGTRAGLRAEDRIPVDDLLAMSKSPSLQLTAGSWPEVDRRKAARTHEESRVRSRLIEFCGAAAVAAGAGVSAFLMIEQLLARPLRQVLAATGG